MAADARIPVGTCRMLLWVLPTLQLLPPRGRRPTCLHFLGRRLWTALHTGSVSSGLKLQPVISGVTSRPPGDAGGPSSGTGGQLWRSLSKIKSVLSVRAGVGGRQRGLGGVRLILDGDERARDGGNSIHDTPAPPGGVFPRLRAHTQTSDDPSVLRA